MMDFFFISSPLHLMMAANMAIRDPSRERVAIIISKDAGARQRHAALARLFPLLFNTVIALPGHDRRPCRGWTSERFRILERLFNRQMEARVFTGNDRRIEFQYAMHIASRVNRDVEGVYLDEGAVTYTGHKSMHSIQHRYVDPFFKKLFCGFWYRNAITTGTSAWIRTAYVAFPEAVHPLLKSKSLVAIDAAPFKTQAFKDLASAMLEGHEDYRERLRGIRCVLTLPHEGSYLHRPGKYEQINRQLGACFGPACIAIKPHPRITNTDRIKGMFPGATLLDHRVGMEALLPLLTDECIVAGDMSSTLLTTRWIRPDLPVVALWGQDAPPAALPGLFATLQIPVVTPDQLAAWCAARPPAAG